MKKVLTTIDDCKCCDHSTHLTTNDIDYSVVVCNKTRAILLVTDKGKVDQARISIPKFCPLPDFVDPKTD